MDSIELVQADTLKTIYFQHQDTLLMTDGSIKTLSFDSPAIDEIKTLVKNDYVEFGFKSLPSMPVEMATPVTMKQWFDSLNVSDMGQNQDSEEQSTQSDLTTTATRAISMLEQAVTQGCSDIHIELFKNQTRIEVRVDGRMVPLFSPIPEREYGEELIGYLFNELSVDKDADFYASKMNNGRMSIPLNSPDGKRVMDWRLSYIPAKDKGGQGTLRWLNKNTTNPSIDELGWEVGQIKAIRDFMASPYGVCLIAGQTSSGKSTVIAAILNEMKRQGRSINTLEDPVEFDLGIIQTPVIKKKGEDDGFFEASKTLLRHDVDIEMHGEIRDLKGAMSVCRKGSTGQLMFSTLHTSSVVGIAHTLNKQMHVPSSLIGAPDLMKMWIYQTLVRVVCPHCCQSLAKARKTWSEAKLDKFNAWREEHGSVPIDKLRFRSEEGCDQCVEGEKGRTTLLEMLILDDEDRSYILKEDYLGWLGALKSKGFKSVVDHANLKISRGEVDLFTAAGRVDGLFPKDTTAIYQRLWEA